MAWENVRAAELNAIATFELCNTLREVHGLPEIDYYEKLNFKPDFYPVTIKKKKKWALKEVDESTRNFVLNLATSESLDIVYYYGNTYYVRRDEEIVLKICKE